MSEPFSLVQIFAKGSNVQEKYFTCVTQIVIIIGRTKVSLAGRTAQTPAFCSRCVAGVGLWTVVYKTCTVHVKKISNQVLVLKSMKIREIWTTKYIEWLVRTRQIGL